MRDGPSAVELRLEKLEGILDDLDRLLLMAPVYEKPWETLLAVKLILNKRRQGLPEKGEGADGCDVAGVFDV